MFLPVPPIMLIDFLPRVGFAGLIMLYFLFSFISMVSEPKLIRDIFVFIILNYDFDFYNQFKVLFRD